MSDDQKNYESGIKLIRNVHKYFSDQQSFYNTVVRDLERYKTLDEGKTEVLIKSLKLASRASQLMLDVFTEMLERAYKVN